MSTLSTDYIAELASRYAELIGVDVEYDPEDAIMLSHALSVIISRECGFSFEEHK